MVVTTSQCLSSGKKVRFTSHVIEYPNMTQKDSFLQKIFYEISLEKNPGLWQDDSDSTDKNIERIKFLYKMKIGNKGNTKCVSIVDGNNTFEGKTIRTNNDPAMAGQMLTLDDVEIKVHYRQSDTVKTDVNCNSAYISAAMDRVGQSI